MDRRVVALDELSAVSVDPDCPGPGQCHGCVAWCNECGDVATTCPNPTCEAHHCDRCGVLLTDDDREFDRDWIMFCRACHVAVAMEHALARGEDECAAGERAQASIDAFTRVL